MIPDNIKKLYSIDKDVEYNCEHVNPLKLLNSSRLDIAAKYIFLFFKDILPQYAEEVYSEHIRCMTKGAFIEPLSTKNNLKSFISEFNNLYNKMKGSGYDEQYPIPVDRNYKILDGAHRVAIALCLGIEIPVVRIDIEGKYDTYDQAYFESYGIDKNILEDIVRMYIKLHSNTYCINIWPSAQGHDKELLLIINRYFDIIYKKEVFFKEEAALLYLAQIYSEYSWAQNIADVYRKLLPCFPHNNKPVQIFFVTRNAKNTENSDSKSESEIDKELIAIKEKLRSLYNLEKHSLHITDSQQETEEMGEILLNENSIDFLSNSNPLKFKSTFELIKSIKQKNNIFTGSIILALYGLREANDIDYISEIDGDLDSHNYLLQYYPTSKENLLYNPRYSFSFFGVKFLTLETIKEFKEKRNESKDKDDVKLITLVGKTKSKKVTIIRMKRRLIAKLQGSIIKIAHMTGTYEILRGIYKKIW